MRGPKCWLAFFPGDARVLDAFGCNILPTSWTLQASAEDVLQSLRVLNPGAIVVLSPGGERLWDGLAQDERPLGEAEARP